MITKDQNIALLSVGNLASKNPKWIDYANYCIDREKGLRKQAFKHLNEFLKSTEKWILEDKIDFMKFLFPFFESIPDADYGPFPQPLRDRLTKPALAAWCDLEQTDSSPFRWYGKYYRSELHLFKALELNSKDDIARQTILSWWTFDIYYGIHHLPDYYIGNPQEDIELSEKIKDQINQLSTPELRKKWTEEFKEDLEILTNYIEWKKSGDQDLEKWGQKNNKIVSYNIGRAYYYEK